MAPEPGRPRIKVCGVTTVDDARRATRLGADMIGLNFYAPSPRFVSVERALAIAESVRAEAAGSPPPKLVGVFVNARAETIRDIASAVGLDWIQFHGDEKPELVSEFGRRAIKAIRADGCVDPSQVTPYLARGDGPLAFLIDTAHPELWGGSGEAWRHESLVDLGRPVILAGGLSPANVAEAVRAAAQGSKGVWAVDVCSGIESSPGVKDPGLMARFFEEAQHAQTATAS